MSDERYRQLQRFLKDNLGTVFVDLDAQDERLRLSPHRYAEDHETVVQAALWIRADRRDGSPKYKTFITRELDSGGDGHGSIVNDGAYAETREEAIAWLEETAQEYGGSSLDWEERPRVVIDGEDSELADDFA